MQRGARLFLKMLSVSTWGLDFGSSWLLLGRGAGARSARICARTCARTCVFTYTHMHMHTHMRTHMHTRIRMHIHTHMVLIWFGLDLVLGRYCSSNR